MSRNLTINQTYHVNGYEVRAQLEPRALNPPDYLVLWAQIPDQASWNQLMFIRRHHGWRLIGGDHPDVDGLCEWVNLDPDALCNGLF